MWTRESLKTAGQLKALKDGGLSNVEIIDLIASVEDCFGSRLAALDEIARKVV